MKKRLTFGVADSNSNFRPFTHLQFLCNCLCIAIAFLQLLREFSFFGEKIHPHCVCFQHCFKRGGVIGPDFLQQKLSIPDITNKMVISRLFHKLQTKTFQNKPGRAQVGAISKAQQIVKFGKKSIMFYEKWKRYIWTLKTLYPNFETLYQS